MIKIAEIVREIVSSSEIAFAAFSEGYLNLSAYAKSILKEVELKAKKPVKVGSIVAALSRLSAQPQASLIPGAEFESISVKSGLAEMTFPRTKETSAKLSRIHLKKDFSSADFFTIAQGVAEVSIVAPERLLPTLCLIFKGYKPKLIVKGLAVLTVRFDEKYLDIPNVCYSFIRSLALRRTNIVGIVAAFTELSFILHEQDLEESFSIMNKLFKTNERN